MPSSSPRQSPYGSNQPPSSPSPSSASAPLPSLPLPSWRPRPLRKGPSPSESNRPSPLPGNFRGQHSPQFASSSVSSSPRSGTSTIGHEDQDIVPTSTTIVQRAAKPAGAATLPAAGKKLDNEDHRGVESASLSAAAAAAHDYFYAKSFYVRPPAGIDGTSPLKPAPRTLRSGSSSIHGSNSGSAFARDPNALQGTSQLSSSPSSRISTLYSPPTGTQSMVEDPYGDPFDSPSIAEDFLDDDKTSARDGDGDEEQNGVAIKGQELQDSADPASQQPPPSPSQSMHSVSSGRAMHPAPADPLEEVHGPSLPRLYPSSPPSPSASSPSAASSAWVPRPPRAGPRRAVNRVAAPPAPPISACSPPPPPLHTTTARPSPPPASSALRSAAGCAPSQPRSAPQRPPSLSASLRFSHTQHPQVSTQSPSEPAAVNIQSFSTATTPTTIEDDGAVVQAEQHLTKPSVAVRPLPPPLRASPTSQSHSSNSSARTATSTVSVPPSPAPLSAFIDPSIALRLRSTSLGIDSQNTTLKPNSIKPRPTANDTHHPSSSNLATLPETTDAGGVRAMDHGPSSHGSRLEGETTASGNLNNGATSSRVENTSNTDQSLGRTQNATFSSTSVGAAAIRSLSHKDSFGGFRTEFSSSSTGMPKLATSQIDAVGEEVEDEVRDEMRSGSDQAGGIVSLDNGLRSSQDSGESRMNQSAESNVGRKGSTTSAFSVGHILSSRSGSSDGNPVASGTSLATHWPRRGPTSGLTATPAYQSSTMRPRNGNTPASSNDRSEQRQTSSRREKPSHRSVPSRGEFSRSTSHRLVMPTFPSAAVTPAPPPIMYWSRAPVHGQVPKRSFRAHTASLADDTVWLFGGCDSKGCFSSLWCFDIETMCWSRPKVNGDCPSPRRAHSTTVVDGRLYVFAGGDGPHYYQDLYVFDIVALKWTKPEVYGPLPSPRRAHSANYWNGHIVIFGGGNGVGALNDLWLLDVRDPDRLEWKRVECAGKMPVGRGYHSGNVVDDKLIVIGGSDGHMSFNDIHVLKLDGALVPGVSSHGPGPKSYTPVPTWYQVKTDEVHNRLGHTSTQVGSYLFVFGGHDSNEYTNELLTLNLVNLQWESRRVCGKRPAGRGYHQACLKDSRLFVHGGFDGREIFDDLHYLDLAASSYLPQITQFEVSLENDEEEGYHGKEGGKSSSFGDGAGQQILYSEDGTTDEEHALRGNKIHDRTARGTFPSAAPQIITGVSDSSSDFVMARGASGGPLTSCSDGSGANPWGLLSVPASPLSPHNAPLPLRSPVPATNSAISVPGLSLRERRGFGSASSGSSGGNDGGRATLGRTQAAAALQGGAGGNSAMGPGGARGNMI